MHINRPISTLRVLTSNLWQRYGAWADRRRVLVDHIRAAQADLIGFAESVTTQDYDQTSDLLGPEFIVVHSRARDVSGMGISIASRCPVLEVQELNLNVSARTAGFPSTTPDGRDRHTRANRSFIVGQFIFRTGS